MGDCLQTGKPSRYITNHPDSGQLSLPSLDPGWENQISACLSEVKAGAITRVGWQVTLIPYGTRRSSFSYRTVNNCKLYSCVSYVSSLITYHITMLQAVHMTCSPGRMRPEVWRHLSLSRQPSSIPSVTATYHNDTSRTPSAGTRPFDVSSYYY